MVEDPDEIETGTSLDEVPYGTLPPGPDREAHQKVDRLIWESVRANYQALLSRDSAKTQQAADLLGQALMHWTVSGRPPERNHQGVHVLQVLAMVRFNIATDRHAAGQPMFPELDDEA